MGGQEAIALVFLFLVIWVGTILVLLSRVDPMRGGNDATNGEPVERLRITRTK
jgi:hypothetical protein